jgi:hypothetical protein
MRPDRPRRLPKLRLRTAFTRVGLTSCAAALAVTAGLWLQMASGKDPAIGLGDTAAGSAGRPAVSASSVAVPASTPPDVGAGATVVPAAPAPVQSATS